MSNNVSRLGKGGLLEAETNAGPDAYVQGGFEITSDTGRVDEVTVECDSPDYEARATDVTENIVTVQVYSQDGSGEVAADVDLSTVNFTHTAYRL